MGVATVSYHVIKITKRCESRPLRQTRVAAIT